MLVVAATFASATQLPVLAATHYLLEGILTLVVPLAVLIVIAVWYVRIWRGGMGQR
jgi:hypothetical protein